ncbi:hypothetical protein J9B83_11705 [Marinomonas sp. A79]|uniref:Lipocalin-like domain-containing protein n=1 Tax=Marinomonas vulgaris TaxID=2823372 RepID=A0ABS5HD67_9GAMM|nr:hypothetical protein [Marinomonas vulgaris]MBR7889606.1 hypothetical protein [Marinomonas vulgaris]
MSQLVKVSLASAVMGVSLSASVQANELNLAGQWQLQNAENTQATLEAAVQTVAKEMNFFIRALAKPVLRKQTQICDQWRLGWQNTTFHWQCDDAEVDAVPVLAQRDWIKTDEEGVDILGTYQQGANSVVVIVESERGKRTNTWQRLGDNELRYTAKLESEKLPTPLTWTLTYKRLP